MNEYRKVPDYKIKDTGEELEPGYEERVRARIEESLRYVKNGGKTIPAEKIWRKLGIDD